MGYLGEGRNRGRGGKGGSVKKVGEGGMCGFDGALLGMMVLEEMMVREVEVVGVAVVMGFSLVIMMLEEAEVMAAMGAIPTKACLLS